MSPPIIGILSFVPLFLLLFLGMPIGFGMLVVGFLGIIYLATLDVAISIVGLVSYGVGTTNSLIVIPLFVLMGQFAFYSGLSHSIYYCMSKLVGRLPGGLAIATVGGCAGFAAVTGSSVVTTATMGAVALPEMTEYKYNAGLSTGCIAAGGTLGILIPPSIGFVVYAMLTEQSIGRLFLAGFFPGLLLASAFALAIYVIAKIDPGAAPPGREANLKEIVSSFKDAWEVVLLFLVVVGGIYLGIFTPNEAAAVGAFVALILGVRRRSLSWKNMLDSLLYTGQTTAMILVIIVGAFVFNRFLALTELPALLAEFVAGLEMNPYILLGCVILIYIILGCIMDVYAMLVLTMPILFPVILSLGFDPIWYGVVTVITIEMGLITPPVGLNVFVMHGVAKDVPLFTIFRGILPFFIAMMVCIIILIIFPQIALFLPSAVK